MPSSCRSRPHGGYLRLNHEAVEILIKECHLAGCLECGKCTACCPYRELFGDLRLGRSPRRIIEKALRDVDLVADESIWCCPTCDECTDHCPAGVGIRDFITGIRRLAIEAGFISHAVLCARCGTYLLPAVSHAHLTKKLSPEGGDPPPHLELCPRCRAMDFSRRVRESLPGRRRTG